MGKRGPPKKSLEQKALEGTSRPDRDNPRKEVVTPKAGEPPKPSSLGKEAALIWDEVVPQLLELGTISETDGGVLQGYCMTLARVVKLEKSAMKEPIIESPFGDKLNPCAAEARKLWLVVKALAVDLGLSYAARDRVTMPKRDEKKDPTGAFLFENAPPLTIVRGFTQDVVK